MIIIKSRHFYLLVIAFVILIGAANSLEFNYYFGNGAFQRDYFRHFNNNILPVINGSGSLANLFQNHHSSPLLHLHQITTNTLGDDSLRGNAYVGITIFSMIAMCLGVAAYRGLAATTDLKGYSLAIGCTVALLLSSLTTKQPVEVPLIYLQSYFFALGLAVAVSTYLLCVQPFSGSRALLYIFSVILAIVMHSSFGTLFFLASISAIAIRILVRRNYRLLIPLLAVIAFAYFWNAHTLPWLGHKNPPRIDPIRYLLNNLTEIPFMISAFGKSLLVGFHGAA